MTPYLISAVAVFGFAYIMGHSVISLPLRTAMYRFDTVGKFLVMMLECPACFSVHLGWSMYLLGWTPHFDNIFFSSCFYAGSSLILALLTGLMQRPTPIPQVHFDPVKNPDEKEKE